MMVKIVNVSWVHISEVQFLEAWQNVLPFFPGSLHGGRSLRTCVLALEAGCFLFDHTQCTWSVVWTRARPGSSMVSIALEHDTHARLQIGQTW